MMFQKIGSKWRTFSSRSRKQLNITAEDLAELDITQFNEGRSPYPPGDKSAEMSFPLGLEKMRYIVSKKTKFTGGKNVLDLLSGCGRWSLFLAEKNDFVVGIERIPECVKTAENMCSHFGVKNVHFICGEDSETHQFGDEEFDYIWMWSAMQYVDRGKVMPEISRLLRSGGRLYVTNYNSYGLMITHFLNGVKSGQINHGASQWALDALSHGPLYDGAPNFCTPEHIGEVCSRYGLRLIKATGEGKLDLSKSNLEDPKVKPRMVEEHYLSTMEFVAEKIS
jgi:SAM-dependent methyltransferase